RRHARAGRRRAGRSRRRPPLRRADPADGASTPERVTVVVIPVSPWTSSGELLTWGGRADAGPRRPSAPSGRGSFRGPSGGAGLGQASENIFLFAVAAG